MKIRENRSKNKVQKRESIEERYEEKKTSRIVDRSKSKLIQERR